MGRRTEMGVGVDGMRRLNANLVCRCSMIQNQLKGGHKECDCSE